jgi:hypothetical protein
MRRQRKEAKQRKCTMTSTKAVGSDKELPVISAEYRQWVTPYTVTQSVHLLASYATFMGGGGMFERNFMHNFSTYELPIVLKTP